MLYMACTLIQLGASLYDKLTTSADGKGTFAKSVDVGKNHITSKK